MTPFDLTILIAYFLLVFGVAWWVTVRDRRAGAGKGAADYFLAGRNTGWFVIGASLFASNIGSEHVVGLVGAGARGHMPNAQFEILASLILILLGWVFVPFYLKSGVFTMPEFLERRYSPAARTYLSVISVLGYVLTKIAVTIFAGALVFEVLGVPFWQGAILVVLATGIYTMLGGLRAVIYTDMLQLFILLGGAIAMTAFGLKTLGGWGAMMQTLEQSGPGESTRFLSLWRPASDPNYPWTGMLFGAPILGVWYWCTDQF
ncbi:MAG: sodium/solute symporter, partial [Gemmatimonadetes bacterium]|nr:sodium/solute symporter [Gemmatimonadota bacterium]